MNTNYTEIYTSANPLKPSTYSRRVVLAVSGLSPQILTETLYALASSSEDTFIPTEVHLITSAEGARRAELSLLSQDMGWFHRLCQDYRLPEIKFDKSHIHVMCDAKGHPMSDIRTQQDNKAAADFITAHVRSLTADSDCALHASIAGGRKTMGFYLGYALSLYGRPQDRLSHVLVSEPFESSYDFFYPTPYNRVLQTRDGQLADTALAEVTLAEIPFVSLRHGLPSELLTGSATFNESVAAANLKMGPAQLKIDIDKQCILAGSTVVNIPPSELALFAVFARRAFKGELPIAAPTKGLPDQAWGKRYLDEYKLIAGSFADTEATERALKNGMDGEYFSSCKSKLEKRLKTALGNTFTAYRIQDGGTRPRRYSIELRPEVISFSTISK